MKTLRLILWSRPWARMAVLGFSLASAIFGLLSPYFQKAFVDHLMGTETAFLFSSLAQSSPIWLMVMAFATTLTAQFFSMMATYWGAREATFVQRQLSEDLYRKMLSLKRDSLNTRPVGEIVSIYATDVQSATTIIEQTLPMGAAIVFPIILAPIAIHFLYDIPLAATLSTMGVLIFINTVLSARQSRYFYRFKQLAAERTGFVNEWIQNIRTLRILGWIASFEEKIFAKRRQETANRILMLTNGQVMSAIASSGTFFINLSGVAAMVYFQSKPATPGELLALLWILGVFLIRPFRAMPWFFTFIWDALSSIQRLEEFMSIRDAGEAEELSDDSYLFPKAIETLDLKVRGLNLQIQNQQLLNDLDLTIARGEFVAIVGEVGSGKSLLLLSLMRETGATFKEFKIGNEDALQMKPNECRSHFAFVSQEGFVMSASLRENIAFEYDVDSAHDIEMQDSLRKSQFDLANENLSDGLDTEIGERGVNLSGGQRQRVSMARADFYDRSILLLDDCLSAVDVDTEKNLIADLFFSKWKGRTRILVTHRLSVLQKVDRILFMEDGQIVDQGKYPQLLARSQKFRAFTLSVVQADEDSEIQPSPEPEVGFDTIVEGKDGET
jgi:ATP-binding cassette subfamily B multidrug efflux pump